MACHPEQPFTAAQEDRIRDIIRLERREANRRQRPFRVVGAAGPEIAALVDAVEVQRGGTTASAPLLRETGGSVTTLEAECFLSRDPSLAQTTPEALRAPDHVDQQSLGGEVQGVAVHDDAYASGSDARS